MPRVPACASIGRRYGKLVVTAIVGPGGSYRQAVCRCDCGEESRHYLCHLRIGRVKSCGCIRGNSNDYESIESFLESASPEPNTGCYLWEGSWNHNGYGRVNHCNVNYAHRKAWELFNKRSVPAGMCVLHQCDTPACVNPGHLFIGTMKDNYEDMVKKKRNKVRALTEEQVLEIHRANPSGKASQISLAVRYGVTPGTIRYALSRRGPGRL